MKRITLLVFFSLFISQYSYSQGVWTWMAGPKTAGDPAIYGAQGVASPTNRPPALYSAYCWTDLQGNFWMYGGGDTLNNYYSDLWEFNPSTLEWTWVNGTGSTVINFPVYGTQGVPSSSNTPGTRSFTGCSWVDANGDLWLYGGSMNYGMYSDLWRYQIATNQWTWMSGTMYWGALPVYGIIGVPSSVAFPGSRAEIGSSWTDNNGKLWLFGGQSIDSNTIFYYDNRSDMWMYDPSQNTWTWQSGSHLPEAIPNYGTKGIFSPSNTPGARLPYSMWVDDNNNLWLFGGGIFNGLNGHGLSDMWEYNTSLNQWAWMNGMQKPDSTAKAGAACQPDSGFYPDGRFENRDAWKDKNGNLWMYGGFIGGYTLDTTYAPLLGDMWEYIVKCNEWKRMSDSGYRNIQTSYGTLGVPSTSNYPGARGGSEHWQDSQGNFWISGGFAFEFSGGIISDMWRYTPDFTCGAAVVKAIPDSVCPGSTSQLSVAGSLPVIQWQSSTDGISFTDIPGATSATYESQPIQQNTFFRVKTSGNCAIDSSAVILVSISKNASAGTITRGRDSICLGSGLISQITSAGSSGNLQWQSSSDGTSFTNIAGATSSSYTTPPFLAQNTFYRLVAGGSNCGFDTSNTVVVHIVPAPVAVFNYTIKGDQVTFNSSGTSSNVVAYYWDFADSTNSSDPNPMHTFSRADTFYVCLTVYNNSNCSYTLCKYVDLITGVGNVDGNEFIHLYPNPANSTINLAVKGITGNYELKIYNGIGQQILQQQVMLDSGKIIPIVLSNFSQGLYELTLTNNSECYESKFVHLK